MSDLMSFKKNMEFLGMPLPSDPSMFGIQPGKATSRMLAEGDAITIKGTAALIASTGTVNSPAGLQNYSLTLGATLVIGPFAGRQKIAISPATGSISAEVGDAVLGAVTPSDLGDLTSGGAALPVVGNHSDFYIDLIAIGMVLPTTGGLSNFITAGVAYVTGRRRAFAGQAIALTASSDCYIDAKNDGTYAVSPVAIGGAAPAVAVNAIRMGYITTGASAVSAVVQTGKDSLGNWMGNRVRERTCILGDANTQGLAAGTDTYINFNSAALEVLDNSLMHSTTTNSSRITFSAGGMYRVTGWAAWATGNGAMSVALTKNRAGRIAGTPPDQIGPSGKLSSLVTGLSYFNAGDFLELRLNSVGAMSITLAGMSAEQVG